MIGPTRKMPDCPRCGQDELYIGSVWWLSVNCYLCSWTSDEIKVWDGESISDAIERAVEDAKVGTWK